MNYRMVFNTIGRISRIETLLLLLPAAVSLVYGEYNAFWSLLAVSVLAFLLGTFFKLAFKPKDHIIYAKDGFIIVSLSWIYVALIGALPFTISHEIPSYIDALFETVSGFTTTGASIIRDVELLSHGMLFWRSFTHFIGGMGFLVFVMAIIPNLSDRSIYILRAEVPGPVVGKLVPKIKDTAKILYLIYIALTAIEAILLATAGMPIFDSIVHAFGTAGTGGFGIKGDSIASYSPYCQWIITVFMLLFGVNFNLYYLILLGKIKPVFKSSEFRCYGLLVLICSVIIGLNIFPIYRNISEAARTSAFQVASIITTTGYATADFNTWPALSKSILFMLMFLGACAGSTGGGFKIARAMMIFKIIGREIKKLVRPRSVNAVKFEGKQLDEQTLNSAAVYFAIYFVCILTAFLLISFEPFGFESNFTAAVSCFNNIGPGLDAVGPASNYAAYTDFSKIVLSAAMLFGRLEIFPLIIGFSPSAWSKRW